MGIFDGDQELPDYMYAADLHNVANGKGSVIDRTAEEGVDFGKFAISATARAVTSIYNTVPSIANIFGAGMEEADVGTVLKAFDDDLAAYYEANRSTVDVVGDVAAMFVPGMAGVKGINYAQKGLSAISAGSGYGRNIARSFGLLPELGSTYATKARLAMAETGNTFRVLDGNVLKSFASNYAQGAVEMAAFEVAAAASMSSSPLFEDHSVTDILYNAALGGGAVGAGIMGSVAAAQTYGQLKRAGDTIGKALAPFRFAKSTEEGVDDFVKVLDLRKQRDMLPIPEEVDITGLKTAEEIDAVRKSAARISDKQRMNLNLEITETLTKMAGGDADLGSQMYKLLDDLDRDKAWAAMLQLKQMSRTGKVTSLEAESLARAKPDDTVVKYLKTWGEDAGVVYNSAPVAPRLADLVGSEKELLKDVEKRFKSQPDIGGTWSPLGKDHLDVEARYIKAFSSDITPGQAIDLTDLPFLEKALHDKVPVYVDGLLHDTTQLREHIKKTKQVLADSIADTVPNTEVASRLLNVKRGVLEGAGYDATSDSHFFAVTPDDPFTKPNVVKMVYKGDHATVGVDGNELSGMIQIKQLQEAQRKINETAAAKVLGEDFERLIKIPDAHILDASPRGAGAGFASMASAEYGTLGSIVEWLGKVANEAKSKAHKAIATTFEAPAYKLLNNAEAQAELFALRQAVLQTGEKYVLDSRQGVNRMVLKSVADYERKVIAGKQAVEPVIPKGVPREITIKQDDTWEFMQTLVSHNNSYLEKEAVLRNAAGKGMGKWDDVVYFPQLHSKEFPYFSFVVPKNPFAEQQTQMIWARSADELAKLESAVGSEYRLIRKGDTERYYKAMKEYDSGRSLNNRDFMSDLARKGTAAPFIAKTNAPELVDEIISHYKQASDTQIRDAITLHNNVAFSELRRMDTEFKSVRASKKPGTGEDIGVTPYESYVKTALDIPRSSSVPVWTELNNLAENVTTRIWNTLKTSVQGIKSPEDMKKISDVFDENGIRGIKDAYVDLLANHPADKRVLSDFVASANGLFATLMLRTDPMNALNNGVGSLVLTGSETAYLTRLIKGKGGAEAESFLRDLSEIRLPGTQEYIKSPTKLISRAYKSFFDYFTGDAVAVEKFKRFDSNGWLPDMMDQIKASLDSMSIKGVESTSEMQAKISQMMKTTGDFLEKASLNKFAEQMNRYVAAHIADEIADAGIKYAGLSEKESLAFINTFVNRTQGNYVASQRPLMFQGPIGQSISLFMTYQFNMMQHLFRHLSNEGGRVNAAILLGLQNSIYGMNGLPAFNFMNEHLVGNAAGNVNHSDAYSVGMDIPGVGDWLLYGGLSNVTGLGLYSRGDMNPRHVTVVPSSVKDIPFVSATTGFFSSMGKSASEISAGADPVSTILRGIEHAGISRPLAGLAQVLNGVYRGEDDLYTTSQKGNVVYAQDLYSLATLGRIAGARPLDEAVTRDAYYRVQVYEGQDNAKKQTLGAAIRDKINSKSEIQDSDVEDFMHKYVSAGGSQANFAKWYGQQVKNAGQNQVKKLVERGNSSYGQYMQNLMRGLDSVPEDLAAN